MLEMFLSRHKVIWYPLGGGLLDGSFLSPTLTLDSPCPHTVLEVSRASPVSPLEHGCVLWVCQHLDIAPAKTWWSWFPHGIRDDGNGPESDCIPTFSPFPFPISISLPPAFQPILLPVWPARGSIHRTRRFSPLIVCRDGVEGIWGCHWRWGRRNAAEGFSIHPTTPVCVRPWTPCSGEEKGLMVSDLCPLCFCNSACF